MYEICSKLVCLWLKIEYTPSFYEMCGQYYKTILGVIYATSGVFPYDFDWGYIDSDVIMSKKVL